MGQDQLERLALFLMLMSAVELGLYGNWIDSLTGRLSFVASTLVITSAVAMGMRALQSSSLVQSFSQVLPYFAFARVRRRGLGRAGNPVWIFSCGF